MIGALITSSPALTTSPHAGDTCTSLTPSFLFSRLIPVMELLHSDLYKLLHHSQVELSFYTRMKMCKDIALGSTLPRLTTLLHLASPSTTRAGPNRRTPTRARPSELVAQNRARCSAQGLEDSQSPRREAGHRVQSESCGYVGLSAPSPLLECKAVAVGG